MGDSPRYRTRSAYAQPGEIDTSLVDAESLRPRPASKPGPTRSTFTPLSSLPESRPTALRPVAECERKSLVSAHATESRTSPLRPDPTEDPFHKSLAPAPGLVAGKPAAFRLGIDPGLSLRDSALRRGWAPPPGLPSVPNRRSLDTRPPVFERKPAAPTPARPEPKQVSENPELRKLPSLSAPKSLLVPQGVSARFELLPEAKPQWNRVGLSAGGQLVILGFLLLSPMFFTESMQTALKFDVIELAQPVIPVAPETPKPSAPRHPPKPKPKAIVEPKAPELRPEIPELAPLGPPQLAPQRPHIFMNSKPLAPNSHTVEANAPELQQNQTQLEIVWSSNGPKAPKEEVKPNSGTGNSAPGAGNAAFSKVQTGTFGDPNGIAGSGNSNHRGNINTIGAPGSAGGPGHGNGTGNGKGLSGAGGSAGSGRAGGANAGGSAGVNILYKPKPAYSAEGREHKIQGDVVLEVVFLASGQIKVISVVSGLGFGMDDEAIRAAQRIRFTPAMREGNPVDVPARVRIEFRVLD